MKVVPARNGWLWIVQGLTLFRRSPARWTLLVLTYWILVALMNQIPLAGTVIAMIFVPAFSVSFMEMCDRVARGGALGPMLLLAGFRRELTALVVLGGVNLVAILLVLALSALADGGALLKWALDGTPPPAAALRDGSLSTAMMLAAVAGTPVLLAFWFAPLLVAWQRMNAVKALFFSFFAGWRNWRAFLLYGAVLSVVIVALSVVVLFAAVLLRRQPELLRVVMIVFTLLALPILFGSFYASYRDVFPDAAPGEEQAGGEAP